MLNKTVPGHHLHYTVVTAEKVDIPGHFKHVTVRGFFWGEDQLLNVIGKYSACRGNVRAQHCGKVSSLLCNKLA